MGRFRHTIEHQIERAARTDPLFHELYTPHLPTTSVYRERDANIITRAPALFRGPVSDFPSGPADSSRIFFRVSGTPAANRQLVPARKPERPPQADRRLFHPAGANAPASTVYGLAADQITNPAVRSSAVQVFKNPTQVVPCIQRTVRREVMFARKKAGVGYRKRKRRTWLSDIPC